MQAASNPNCPPFAPKIGETVVPVALVPLPASYQSDFTLEPPMVQVRGGNESLVYLNSNSIGTTQLKRVNRSQMVISAPGAAVITSNIKRLAVAYINFKHCTPVINQTNNTLYIYVVQTNIVYTVVLRPGDYVTPQLLYTEFIRAVNANAALAAACTFTPIFKGNSSTTVPVPTSSKRVTLVSSSAVYFLPQSPLMVNGVSTFNLPVIEGSRWNGVASGILPEQQTEWNALAATVQMSGDMPCRYTTYIDFQSGSLTRWTKNSTVTSESKSASLLYRLYVPTFTDYASDPGAIVITDTTAAIAGTPIIYERTTGDYESAPITLAWITANPSENINTVDITVTDQYGALFASAEPVYEYVVGSNVISTKTPAGWTGGLTYTIVLATQI